MVSRKEHEAALVELKNLYPYQFNEDTQMYLPPGWMTLFTSLCEQVDVALTQVGGDAKEKFSWFQVKEKFAGLRAYYTYDYSRPEAKIIFEIKSAAERLSCAICEVCGEEGKKGNPTGRWLHTVCDKHNNADFAFYSE
jgi:hypothetical protein